MSSISISYDNLKDASDEGKNIAKKLDRYADSIKSDIYNKFNNYDGKWTSNITTARNNINSKLSELRNKSDQYQIYANNLIDLRDQCKTTDKAVKQKVSTLTATFKTNHGIKNSKIQNTVSYFMTSIGNSTAVGRWLGNGKDMIESGKDYLKECIEDWYQFEGGKDFLKGTLVASLEIAIGVLSIAIAIVIGGALLVVIAGVIAGVIAVANGIANFKNEIKAYGATQNNDPATGKRRSSLNIWTDTIRTDSDNKLAHNVATGIDVVNFACSVVTFVSSFKDLLKNGYKWTTGSVKKLEEIKMKDVLTRDNLNLFNGKIKTGTVDGLTEIASSIKRKDWTIFKSISKNVSTDFIKNFEYKFSNFTDMKKGLKSTKNILGVGKDLFKGGININNIINVGIKNIALPCITIVDLPIAEGGNYQAIVADDFYKTFKNGSKIIKGIVSLGVVKDSPIKLDVLNKLSEGCNIKVEIQDIHIPQINFNRVKINIA